MAQNRKTTPPALQHHLEKLCGIEITRYTYDYKSSAYESIYSLEVNQVLCSKCGSVHLFLLREGGRGVGLLLVHGKGVGLRRKGAQAMWSRF